MRVETYRPGHASALISCLREHEPIAEDLWRWTFDDNPARLAEESPSAALAFDEAGGISGVRTAMPVDILRRGGRVRAAQLVGRLSHASALSKQQDLTLAHSLLADLEARGREFVFALPSEAWPEEMLQALGFGSPFTVVSRNLYLDYNPFASEPGAPATRFTPVRKVAKLARRLRQKLFEINFEENWLGYAERLFDQRGPEIDFGIQRDAKYLAWRYGRHPDRRYRMCILRRKAGVGLDAFVVWRLVAPGGRPYLQLVDHWTRIGERRSTAWLLGEMVMLALAEEEAAAIQAVAPMGSALEQSLIASGCIRKKEQQPLMVKLLGDKPSPDLAIRGAHVQLRAGDFEAF